SGTSILAPVRLATLLSMSPRLVSAVSTVSWPPVYEILGAAGRCSWPNAARALATSRSRTGALRVAGLIGSILRGGMVLLRQYFAGFHLSCARVGLAIVITISPVCVSRSHRWPRARESAVPCGAGGGQRFAGGDGHPHAISRIHKWRGTPSIR